MLAPVAYGIAANYTKQKLAMASPLVVATGSQLAATLMLLPLAVPLWPAHPISLNAWLAAIALAVVCTAWAYLLFFRLIAQVGPGKAIAVTFLIPLFAIVWGGVFLGETLTPAMVAGGGIILLGIALALGLWSPRWLASAKTD